MTEPRSDLELVRAAAAGDREAFTVLVEQELPRVRRFLHRLGGRAHGMDVDDLAQETFVAVIRGLARFRGEARFSTWVLGCAVNVWRNFRRRGTRETGDATALERAEGPEDPKGPEWKESVDRVEHAVRRLPDALREAFLLRYVEDLTGAEAAIALGLPEGTVRRRAWEARERLRELLKGVLQ